MPYHESDSMFSYEAKALRKQRYIKHSYGAVALNFFTSAMPHHESDSMSSYEAEALGNQSHESDSMCSYEAEVLGKHRYISKQPLGFEALKLVRVYAVVVPRPFRNRC